MASLGPILFPPALFVAGLMMALVLHPASAADWSKVEKVTVVTVEYAFKPASLTFHQGIAYRLRLDNKGTETHEFTAPDFFKAIEVRDPKVLNADRTEIVIPPGRHKNFYFVAKQTGAFKLICSDHDWAGMVGGITIAP